MGTILLSTMFGLFTKSLFSLPGLILLIVDVLVLRSIWQSDTKSDPAKIGWSLLVFFFPVGGLILYWIFG